MNDLGLFELLAHAGMPGISVRHPVLLLALVGAAWLVTRGHAAADRTAARLRAAAIALTAGALAGVGLTASLPAERRTVIVAVDVSESVGAAGRAWSSRLISRLGRRLPPGDELGVVTFGASARVSTAPAPARSAGDLAWPASISATDVEQGLETALALLPAGGGHRIVLITDGNETRGNARAVIPLARLAGASVFTALPPHADGPDVSVEKLAAPSLVADGTVFPLRVVARNSTAIRPATLTLSVDGQQVGKEAIVLQPGANAIEIPYRLTGGGSRRLRAEITAAGDGIAGNNWRDATVTVASAPRVLLISPHARSTIAEALLRKGIAVESIGPSEFPPAADALLEYHCIVAEALTSVDLPPPAMEAIERYVRDFGGGFVFAGGHESFGDRKFENTAIARVLPVTFEPRRPPRPERQPLALMLVVDRSNSMGYTSRAPSDPRLPAQDATRSKLHYARAAALAVVRQMADTDSAGVIAFDTQALPVADLEPLARSRARLEDLIPKITENGGTYFRDALAAARAQLGATRSARRHIVLLTDGDTLGADEVYEPLIDELAGADISVTAIRIGHDEARVELLERLAKRTGGRFHHVKNPESLAQLMLLDASNVMASGGKQRDLFDPRRGKTTEIVRGMPSTLPPLNDYALARLKDGADMPLYVRAKAEREPLLAAWQYGLGRAAAFTADASRDAGAWVAWEAYGKFWSQVVRWAMREQSPWDLTVEARHRAGVLTLAVRTFDRGADGVLFARVHLGEARTEDVPLVPVAPRLFHAELPAPAAGQYPVTVLRRSAGRDVGQRTEVVTVAEEEDDPREEFRTTRPNVALLEELAEATGGRFGAPVREIAARGGGATRTVRYDLDAVLVPLALVCILADVALRRLGAVSRHPFRHA